MMMHAVTLTVVLSISNIAAVPGPTLQRAQREVVRLYRDIGVDVAWTTRATTGPVPPFAIRVVLIPSETGALRRGARHAMGAAVRVSEHTQVAYVFYRQIEQEADRHDVSTALLLACAIAHEVGHLLLPGRPHSADGLMRANWDRDDFCRANQGHLRFSTEQAARIREGLATGP